MPANSKNISWSDSLSTAVSEYSNSAVVRAGRKWVHRADNMLDGADHALTGVMGGLMIKNTVDANPAVGDAVGFIGTTQSGISALRSVLAVIKVGLLSFFYELNEDGSLNKAHKREWLTTALSVCLLVARLLNPITLLQKLKAFDIGKHATRMGTVVGASFVAVNALNFLHSVKSWWNAGDENQVAKHVAAIGSSGIDTIECSLDFASLSSHAAQIATGCFKILSSVAYLGKELVDEIRNNEPE
jgi:hypothetical protein